MEQLAGFWVDECPDCGRRFEHGTKEGVASLLSLHRCAPNQQPTDDSPKGYEHIGAGLNEAIQLCGKKRQAFIESPEGAELLQRQRELDEAQKWKDRLQPYLMRGIPGLIAGALVNNADHHGRKIKPTKLQAQLDAYKDRKIILVFGEVGTGKTIACCRWLMGFERDGRYMQAHDLGALSPRMTTDRDQIDRVRACSALVLDEVKRTTEAGDKESERVADLLQWRYEHDKPSVVVANMQPDDFDDFGDRLGRRTDPPNGVKLTAADVMCPVQQRRGKR
jgi:hypothetical protein